MRKWQTRCLRWLLTQVCFYPYAAETCAQLCSVFRSYSFYIFDHAVPEDDEKASAEQLPAKDHLQRQQACLLANPPQRLDQAGAIRPLASQSAPQASVAGYDHGPPPPAPTKSPAVAQTQGASVVTPALPSAGASPRPPSASNKVRAMRASKPHSWQAGNAHPWRGNCELVGRWWDWRI